MKIASSLEQAARYARARGRPVVTVGTFDGVHRGHQEILADLVRWAQDAGSLALVITFRNHPQQVLRGQAPPLITGIEHRLLLFERLGVDICAALAFDAAFSRISAEAFVQEVLGATLNARGFQLGYDSRFGHQARGTPELAREVGAARDLEVRVSEPVCAPDGQPISSTAIRAAITAGELSRVAALLGRRASVLGRVVRGASRGRTIGYPTANLDLLDGVHPPAGVYATLARLVSQPNTATAAGNETPQWGSMTNIGVRPTVQEAAGASPLVVETHLFDYSGNLYGERLDVEFIRKLREEQRFDGLDALTRQLHEDEAAARACLADVPAAVRR